MKFEINRISWFESHVYLSRRSSYVYVCACTNLIGTISVLSQLAFKISLQRVLWILMFWIIGVLVFLRYAWIRVTGLFIHGFQERLDDGDGRRM